MRWISECVMGGGAGWGGGMRWIGECDGWGGGMRWISECDGWGVGCGG